MNKNFISLLLLGQVIFTGNAFSQNIAINEKGELPDTSAMLDVSSSTKGFLAPRMSTKQQDAIPLPATGLLIFNTSSGTFNVNTGTAAKPKWVPLSSGGGSITNQLANDVNTIISTVNGVTASSPIVNTVKNTSSANSFSTSVNGVAAPAVPIVNSNTVTLNGSILTSTVNTVASSALDLGPAITSKTWSLTGNTGTTAGTNFIGTTNAADLVTKTSNVERMRITKTGNIGIGTTAPSNALHVVSSANPLLLSGVQAGIISDSLLSINTATGVVRYLSTARFTGTSPAVSNGWSLTGNSGTGTSSYIGTSDATDLVFKVGGIQAGYLGISGSSYATALGVGAKAGFQSTSIGAGATATANNEATALGYNAVAAGYRSIAIGSNAKTASTNENIAIGANSSVNSYQGIAIGSGASTGNNNGAIAVGVSSKAGGYESTAIGNLAKANGQNATAIGNGATANNDNYIMLGNSTVSVIRGSVNFTTYSDGRFKRNVKANVPGLDFILKLRPVTYNWDINKFNAHNRGNEYQATNVKSSGSRSEEEAIRKRQSIVYTGFIAQEVEKAALSSRYNFSGILKPADDKDAYSLSYAEFVVPLVKSVQELSQKNEALESRLDLQQQTIELLMKEIKELKKQSGK